MRIKPLFAVAACIAALGGCHKKAPDRLPEIEALSQQLRACNDVACAEAVQEKLSKMYSLDMSDADRHVYGTVVTSTIDRITELHHAKPAALSRSEIFEAAYAACRLTFLATALKPDEAAQYRSTLADAAKRAGAKLPTAPTATGSAESAERARFDYLAGTVIALANGLADAAVSPRDRFLLVMERDLCELVETYTPGKQFSLEHAEDFAGAAGSAGLDPALVAPFVDAVRRGASLDEIVRSYGPMVDRIRAALRKS